MMIEWAVWSKINESLRLYRLFGLMVLLPLLIGCASPPAGPGPIPATGAPDNNLGETLVVTPTPLPTATPSPIQEVITEVTTSTGLNQIRFLGLTTDEWINLAISLLLFLLGLLVVIPLSYYLLRRIAGLTPTRYDDALLAALEVQVKWLLGLFITQYATNRLALIPAEVKQLLDQLYSGLYVIILTVVVWKLFNLGLAFYQKRTITERDQSHQQAFITFLRRAALALLIVAAAAAILNNFGFNVTLPLTILLLIGLALSIAARDTLVDVIDGFIILFDRPFGIGDRIGLQELDTWGDVVDIGTRTTRIRTLDNRLVVVPNSKIGRNLVVNYTYPDTRYRLETQLQLPYGADIDHVRRIIVTSVQEVEGVLNDLPIDALLEEFGRTAMIFRVRWWIHSYTDTHYLLDRVHSVLYQAFNEAGILMPYPTYDINLKFDPPDRTDLAMGKD